MSRILKFIVAGLVAGMFFLEAPRAHAIFGIRVARKAIAARRAEKALDASDHSAERTPAFQTKDPDLEKLERPEQGSKTM